MAQVETHEQATDPNVTVLRDLRKAVRKEGSWAYSEGNSPFADDRFAHLQPVKPAKGAPLASDLIMEERGPR
jgi:hypothetical protein